jgi:ATP-dependent DNA ligase
MLTLINPVARTTPFDDPDWAVKFDDFRAAADTVRGQLISRNGNWMQRLAGVLDRLPKGHIFDGEIVVLDEAGRPLFDKLLFGRGRPTYVAFDLLEARGIDLRPAAAAGAQGSACARRRRRKELDRAHQRGRRPRAGAAPGGGRGRS